MIKLFRDLLSDKYDTGKLITLLSALVNAKSIAYYVFSQAFFESGDIIVTGLTNNYFAAAIIMAIVDIMLCWCFIYSFLKPNSYNRHNNLAETQSALKTAGTLTELHRGNIVSSGIYSFEHVTQIEQSSVKGDEIWCISGDLEEDANNEDLRSIIHNNVKSGIIYKFFITCVGENISEAASLAIERLTEENRIYKKRLNFILTKEKLIAPDIDIIIYKANRIHERIGFVCVEIGKNQDTYVYQQIDPKILKGIYDKLTEYNVHKKSKSIFPALSQRLKKTKACFVKSFSLWYLIASVAIFILSNWSEKGFLTSGAVGILSVIIEIAITIALMAGIMDSISTYKNAITISSENEEALANFINSQGIQEAATKLAEEETKATLGQKGLGYTDQILQIDENCSAVWLLSDLSHDIANENFINWLSRELNTYKKIKCHIIHTTGKAAVGRTHKLNPLKEMYSDRVKEYSLPNISEHYIWSETHGIVYIQNNNKPSNIYISLGGSNGTLYKKVETNEKDASALLGVLMNIANET